MVGATGNVGREMMMVLAERAFPMRRGRGGGQQSLAWHRGRVRRHRQDAQMQEHRAFRLVGLGYCAVRCRQRPGKGIRPQGGGGRLCRDRQQLALPHGPGRAADRARGEPGCDPRLCQAQYHRQSQLLDRAAGRRTEAAARCRDDQARRRLDLSVGFRARARREWTSCSSRAGRSLSAIRSSR